MTLDEMETFLRDRLARPLPGAAAQRRFAPRPSRRDWAPDLTPAHARHAAVLVLIYPAASGLAVPLTLRHSNLAQHANQISLPGGAIDPGEPPEAAALRETNEEIGVPAAHVRVIGRLSSLWVGVSRFLVYPFVAVADRAPRFAPDPREVESVIEAPLAVLRDPERLKWATRREPAIEYPYFNLDGRQVWGATGMILGEFTCLFDDRHAPPDPR